VRVHGRTRYPTFRFSFGQMRDAERAIAIAIRDPPRKLAKSRSPASIRSLAVITSPGSSGILASLLLERVNRRVIRMEPSTRRAPSLSSFSVVAPFCLFFPLSKTSRHRTAGICIIASDCLSSYHGRHVHASGPSVLASDPDSYANGRVHRAARGIED